MEQFRYLPDATPQLGARPWKTDFTHPGWTELRNRVPTSGTTALLDNTTLRQGLILMRDGLGEDASNNATLVPDLTTLFLAYAYFDEVVVIDQGLVEEERSLVRTIFPEISVVRWADLAELKDPGGESLLRVHHLQLSTIQNQFLKYRRLHDGWVKGWSAIYKVPVRPIDFARESRIESLLDTPGEMARAWSQEVDSPTAAVLNPKRYRRPVWMRNLGTDEERWSALASYHTYRSIFYYTLCEAFDWNYVPCGIRGVATDTIPLDGLRGENHALNPDYGNITLRLARKNAGIADDLNHFRLQLPVLRISPTLAALLKELLKFERHSGFDHPTWTTLSREWRANSAETRQRLREWIRALEHDPFTRNRFANYGAACPTNPFLPKRRAHPWHPWLWAGSGHGSFRQRLIVIFFKPS
jgi:hypothetical protein